MQKNSYKCYIGIDVSKKKLDICTDSKEFTVENSEIGIKQFIKSYQEESAESLIVMEASGGYEQLCLKLLTKAGMNVAIANARRVRDYAKSQGILAKTDKIDARIIRRYAIHSELTVHQAISEEAELKQELLGRREQLVKLIVIEKQRLEKGKKHTKKSIERVIKLLEKELDKIESELKSELSKNEESQLIIERLSSVPGIGEVIATQLHLHLPELGKISNKSIAALSGLAPFNRESGMYQGKRKISGGRYAVKRSLFLAALTAVRHNKRIKLFYERLLSKGKCKMVALVACMRKLIVILNVMMRKETVWEG